MQGAVYAERINQHAHKGTESIWSTACENLWEIADQIFPFKDYCIDEVFDKKKFNT